MSTKTWIIECDRCGRIVDATKEAFMRDGDEDVCRHCYSEEDYQYNVLARINWRAWVTGAIVGICFFMCVYIAYKVVTNLW